MGGSGPARRGAAARARRARARAGDPAGLRGGPAPGDARPPDREARRAPGRPGSSRSCSPRCGSASSSSPTSTACRRTRRSASRSSSSSATRPAAPGSSTPCCAAARARRPRASPRSATPRPAQAALRHSHPEWIAELWWDALGPEAARALLAAGQRAGRGRAARRTRCAPTPAELAARAARRRAPGARPARGAGARRAVRRVRLAAVGGGPVHAPVARRDGGRAPARAAAGRARARPVRRARRQDDAPGGADGRARAGRRGRAPRRPRRRAAPHRGADGRRERRGPHRRRRRAARAAAPTTACSSTRRARTSARSPRAPTRAGARPPDLPARLAREQAAILRAGAERAAPRRHARVLDLHDLARRERGRGAAFLAERADFEADDLRSDVPLWEHARVPGFLQTLPHRDGTEGFFIARLRRREAG